MCPLPNTNNHSHLQKCHAMLVDCRKVCTKPRKNCVVMTNKGLKETCDCIKEDTTGGGSGNAKTTAGGGSGNAETTAGGGSGNAKTTAGGGSQVVVKDTGCVFETKVIVYALAMFSTALLG